MSCDENKKNSVSHSAPHSHAHAHVQPPSRKGAQITTGILEHGVVDWAGNAGLSLLITYNVMPTKTAQNTIEAISNAVAPAVRALGATHPEMKARTAVETMCMCGAGFAVLPIIKTIRENKDTIVNSIQHWWHKDFYDKHPEIKQADIAQAEKSYKENRKGYGQLIGSRLLALAGIIFGLDQGAEAFNSSRRARGLPNIDTVEWKFGSYLYDKLPVKTRDSIINFFSRRGATVESIQPLMREQLAATVGTEAKRMIFSEQARMVQKEISYTGIYAAMMCVMGAVDLVALCGLRTRKAEPKAADSKPAPAVATPAPDVHVTAVNASEPQLQLAT